MNKVRLIDANALSYWLKDQILEKEEADGISAFIEASTLKQVLFHIEDELSFSAPDLQNEVDTE